ncbi:DUF1800 domain-containing protein [Silvibacterium acidisoli]|uniref:DUF1800 domain-containing protein n=1 Tax=Acidobacteriaceae bacterium ZG23-2 TaxID=2883246 RepID=UPI00406C6B65
MMCLPRWTSHFFAGCTLLGIAAGFASAETPGRLSEHGQAVHAVSRLTFGAEPGYVSQVEAMGVHRWIEWELRPEGIDDSALQSKLAMLPAMHLSAQALILKYPPPPVIRQMENGGNESMPVDPVERMIYANALADYRERLNKRAQDAESEPAKPNPQQQSAASKLLTEPAAERWDTLQSMTPGTIRPMLRDLKPAERQRFAEGMTAQQKEVLLALVNEDRVVDNEMMDEKLLRAIYSNRQLDEVMTSFWANHFSVFLHKNGVEPWYLAGYERDVIRPHAMGKFEDLLDAVAHSPAMLEFLDNEQSIGPHSIAAVRAEGNPNRKNAAPGLNENYARELMELHTLGVNGGYTQNDVTEVAKVFTGWGVVNPRDGYGFDFNERRHEPGAKKVLGHTIQEKGEQEGIEVLHLLAMRPATAHFLSTKLAEQFVSDNPPPALVDRMAKTYLRTHGDIRQVLRTMFRSPEFWSQDAYRAKLKTPFEYVVSACRATHATVDDAAPLAASLDRMGMPIYGVQQPNGYSLKADPWLGAGALLARMNFALAFTVDHVPGTTVAVPAQAANPEAEEAALEQQLLNGLADAHTHQTVLTEMNAATDMPQARRLNQFSQLPSGEFFGPPVKPAGVTPTPATTAEALLLGSPDFQRK